MKIKFRWEIPLPEEALNLVSASVKFPIWNLYANYQTCFAKFADGSVYGFGDGSAG